MSLQTGIESWKIDISRQLATHESGLIVQLNADALYPERWTGRCLNARLWAATDFDRRAPLVPRMLRSAIAAFDAAYRSVCVSR